MDTTTTGPANTPKYRPVTPDLSPLPATGFVRLPKILGHLPISKSAWWQGIRDGIYPAGIKLGPRTTAWRVEDIRALIQRLGQRQAVQ